MGTTHVWKEATMSQTVSPQRGRDQPPEDRPLLSTRTLLILLTSLIIGVIAGVLTWLGAPSWVLAGLAAGALSVSILHKLVGH